MKTIKVIDVKPLYDFVVLLEFSDGSRKEIDLDVYLHGEVFEPIRNDPDMFRSVRVAEGERTISWSNGADIDPYSLYYGLIPEWSKEDDEIVAMLERKRKGGFAMPFENVKPEIDVR